MRIYLINANWGNGGPGGVAKDLYYVLRQEGHECRFAYARGNVPSNINSYRIGKKFNVYFHALVSRFLDNAGFMSRKATKKLIDDIVEYKPDIVNLHNILGYSIHVGLLFDYIKKSDINAVWTLHDCWSITGHCITGMCVNWEHGCGKCPRKKEYPVSYFIDRSHKNLIKKKEILSNIKKLQLVTPSQWLANLINKTYLNKYQISVIANGIDLTIFRPTQNDLREQYMLLGKKILLTVAGVWAKTKGAEYFYKLTEVLDDSYAFVMIGKNNDKALKENKKIIHIARTENREELTKWYSVSDVFINPTMGDNLPTVNIEALACGTPVVTFNTGGSGEIIGNCGEVVQAGNIEELKNGIKRCIARDIHSEACVLQARYYDAKERYMKYIDLFNNIK